MEKWIVSTGVAFAVLFVGGMFLCIASTFFMCEKIDISESIKESALFAVFPALVPILTHFVPAVQRPFENVIRNTFGVSENANVLALGYIMMLVAWVSGSRVVASIQTTVCIPTVDEVASFKTYFQNKAARGDSAEASRNAKQT